MSSNSPTNPDNQEIDLAQVSKKIGNMYQNFLAWIFRGFLFARRNIIILAILFIVGAGLGFYLDKNTKVYNHEVIITPNFGSADYVYSKVNLINSKIKERDSAFFKSIGIVNLDNFLEIEIKPIMDVYGFANLREINFELIKLMSEDGDINKVIDNPTTSMNYTNHRLKIITKGLASHKNLIDPLLNYFNNSEYFSQIQKSVQESNLIKLQANEKTIKQIDSLLASFSSSANQSGKNDKLVYYNENTQLNDVLKTKSELIQEQANKRLEIITGDRTVKENASILNIKNTESINGKLKIVFPLLFIGLFLLFGLLRDFYRIQMAKLSDK